MVEDAEDAQVFLEEQKEVQETTEQKGQEQTRPIDRKADDVCRLASACCQSDQHRQRRNGQDRADEMADGVEVFVAVG